MAFAYWYVNRVLKEGDLKVTTKQDENSKEVKPVDVKLLLDYQGKKTEYKARLNNVDTVRDFLDTLQDKQGFSYERTFYTDGVIIDEVNGIKPTEGFRWVIKLGDADVTARLDKDYLKDNDLFNLSLVKVQN
jgi:hypothetical protein